MPHRHRAITAQNLKACCRSCLRRVPCPCTRGLFTSSLRAINMDLWMISHSSLPCAQLPFDLQLETSEHCWLWETPPSWPAGGSKVICCTLGRLLHSVLWLLCPSTEGPGAAVFFLLWVVVFLKIDVLIVVPGSWGRSLRSVWQEDLYTTFALECNCPWCHPSQGKFVWGLQ
jgi:hypothetical protein